MIWMTFECPETGRPLRSLQATTWSAAERDALVALHCPKCSSLHMFASENAVLEMGGRAPKRVPA